MSLRAVLRNSFQLLQDQPRIFIPRIIMTAIWSVFWIHLLRLLRHAGTVTLHDIAVVSVFVFVVTPIQIWVYNAYFIMVKQYHGTGVVLRDAFRNGLQKLPQSLAVFSLLGTLALMLGIPGAVIFLYGTVAGQVLLQITGLLISVSAVAGVMITAYFAPVSVVIGENTFFQNVKQGIAASRQERGEVLLLTGFSIGTLLIANLLQGRLEHVGLLGFGVSRFLEAVVGVYLLLMNPELFLQTGSER